MSKKKERDDFNFEKDIHEMMTGLGNVLGSGYGMLGGILNEIIKDPRDNDEYDLGEGLSLVVDKTLKDNTSRYSHLYKRGEKVSDTYFRLGGMSYGFQGKPFTQVIVYHDYPKDTWGNHCIINTNGTIMIEQTKRFDNLYYKKGVIASMGGTYYNVLTRRPIVKGSTTITSENYLFVENNFYTEFEKGVWKINYETGSHEIFK